MRIHSCSLAFLFILDKCIGRHGKDWYMKCIRTVQASNLSCSLITIHNRHMYVHQD